MEDGVLSTASSKTAGEASLRTVLVTGVSRGCGRAMAVELARRGQTVIGTARSKEKLEFLREECQRLPNGQPHLFATVDVTSDASVKELARRVVEAGLVPDIIVNNAGILNKNNKIWKVPSEEIDKILDTNIKGTINVLRHLLPILVERGHGLVVNMSSTCGRNVAPEYAPYCTSKWAIEGLSRAVAMEVPPGVAVVALDPGVICTDMLVSYYGDRAALFPTPEEWAPVAIETILNLSMEDNGTSSTVPLNEKMKRAMEALGKSYSSNKSNRQLV